MGRRGLHGDEEFSEADRRAIADIRRELDAEFGPLEPAEPLAVEPPPTPASSRPSLRPRPRSPARGTSLFVLGALVGGVVGGVSGGMAALLWLHHVEDPVAPTSPIERRPGAVEQPAAAPRDAPRGETAAVESALTAWLEATKTGDIEGQMRFYPARVPIYYTWRDVPRAAVRAEKRRVFAAATRLDISTDRPTVELAADGATAVSRFRKRYVIEGPNVRRRGAVLQELRWARTADGWRIVGERDAEVLAPRGSIGPERARRGGTIVPTRRRSIRAPT
jgi:hypothetical protein